MPVTIYKKQRQVLQFITQYIQKYGYSPTLTEIAEAFDLSSLATVHEHLSRLAKKGLIRKFDGVVRGIEVLKDEDIKNVGIEVPILGFIAAGKPIEPYTDPDATIFINPSLISAKKRSYVLKVKGDSMIEDGILDGDYVVVEQKQTAEDGDIVVALLDNGLATLKRFFKQKDNIKLAPANAKFKPIYVKNVTIQGKVVGVLRKYN